MANDMGENYVRAPMTRPMRVCLEHITKATELIMVGDLYLITDPGECILTHTDRAMAILRS
jgi:hypothetical protein